MNKIAEKTRTVNLDGTLFFVNNLGTSVRVDNKEKTLSYWKDSSSPYVTHNRKRYRVSRLVALAFIGEPPAGRKYVVQLDPRKEKDFSISNIMWGTQKDYYLIKRLIESETLREDRIIPDEEAISIYLDGVKDDLKSMVATTLGISISELEDLLLKGEKLVKELRADISNDGPSINFRSFNGLEITDEEAKMAQNHYTAGRNIRSLAAYFRTDEDTMYQVISDVDDFQMEKGIKSEEKKIDNPDLGSTPGPELIAKEKKEEENKEELVTEEVTEQEPVYKEVTNPRRGKKSFWSRFKLW